MGKSLSHLSSEATQYSNTADTLTPALEFTPDNGVYWAIQNRVSTGDAPGVPIIMDLRDSGGNPIPVDSEFMLRVERPEDDEPTAISVAEKNIAAWNSLTVAEQRSEDNIDQVKVELKSATVNIRQHDILSFDVVSSDVIDWANSEFFVVREAVDEHRMG